MQINGHTFIIFRILLIIGTTYGLTTGNLLRNGDFSQIETNGRPSFWSIPVIRGNITVQILPRKYLYLNVMKISDYTNDATITMMQKFQLRENTSQNLLLLHFWHKTQMMNRVASVRLEIYDRLNKIIGNEYMKTLGNNLTWKYFVSKRNIPTNAATAAVFIRMYEGTGTVFIANVTIEQVDDWGNETFVVTPRQDATLYMQWSLANNRNDTARYEIYRGEGILSSLNYTHLLVSIPTMFKYGWNIYESMYTDHAVRLNTVYTYQVLARDVNGTIIDQTKLAIGQADVEGGYHEMTILIAFPRTNGIHLSWRLRAKSTAEYVLIYNGIDSILNINQSEAQLLGKYSVQDMKAIVPLSNTGPYLLVSDDGNDVATVKLPRLARPRSVLTPARLAYFREKLKQPGHAQQAFEAIEKYSRGYHRFNVYNHVWPARNSALLYAITKDIRYMNITNLALNVNRKDYTIPNSKNTKLLFASSTMARAQSFDWAYDGFTLQQRQELMQDFQYAASIFTSYTDDHSRNPTDKASNWVAILKSAELVLHLSAYGEEGYPDDQAERRILFLLNELKLHIDHAYGPSGYMQEGLNYLAYTIPILAPAVYLAKDMGISVFDEAWSRPDWHNLALHTISLRDKRISLQFGVGNFSEAYNGLMPYIFNSTNDPNIKAALKWLYDRNMGINATFPNYDGKDCNAALLYYPYEIPAQHPSIAFPRSLSMVIDNIDGFYEFRNRYRDKNDVLIAFMSRNRRHNGWNAAETFALSIISHDTTWARMPGKEFSERGTISKFSTPLIDGWPRFPPSGKNGAYTKSAKAFEGQGGGYVSVDASINFGIVGAQRDILVDMITRGNIDTIIAIRDEFNDNKLHSWHWQLSPEPTETDIIFEKENNLSTFIINGRNNSWLKGWLYNDEDTTFNSTREFLRIIKYGSNASFKIVMVLGMGAIPTADRTKTGLNIVDVCINFDTLEQGLQCPSIIISVVPGYTTTLIILITIATAIASLIVLLLIVLLMKKQKNKTNRVASVPSSPVPIFYTTTPMKQSKSVM